MRVAFVQHGDYRETHLRLTAGGEETYYAQRYSDNAIQQLTDRADEVSVICVKSAEYDEVLSNAVRAIGVPLKSKGRRALAPLVKKLASLSPTHVVLRTPIVPILRWAIAANVQLLPLFADSFPRRWQRLPAYWQLAHCLNNKGIQWVGNHNLPASRDLQRIGVHAEKIIPWDWPPVCRPEDSPVRSLRCGGTGHTVLFVGVQSEDKGLGDLMLAVAEVRKNGHELRCLSIGGGDSRPFREMADNAGIGEYVRFAGRLPHREVLQQMREHDVVVVPSRHGYPEGLPFTIYDALSVRTPIIASDHPMFVEALKDRSAALLYQAGNVSELTQRICELVNDAELYQSLSTHSIEAFNRIECPAKWDRIVDHWLSDTKEDHSWLAQHSLAFSDRYGTS
ncbi:glycosyltransferase family 4 protein [Aeoliella sp.]|uniref:glycosyltransferase family 4 protein n=1 Tax=Aeoliella sp. TaxID=2795800 RepID=UPI003CCBC6A8